MITKSSQKVLSSQKTLRSQGKQENHWPGAASSKPSSMGFICPHPCPSGHSVTATALPKLSARDALQQRSRDVSCKACILLCSPSWDMPSLELARGYVRAVDGVTWGGAAADTQGLGENLHFWGYWIDWTRL